MSGEIEMLSGDGRADGEVVELFVFVLSGQRCAIELDSAERVVRMVAIAPLASAPDHVLGAVNVHGEPVPVVDIGRPFGLQAPSDDPRARLVLARAGGRRVALPVDDALGIVDVPAEAVVDAEDVAPGLQRVSGVVPDDHGLLLIHDLEALLSAEDEGQLAVALGGARAWC